MPHFCSRGVDTGDDIAHGELEKLREVRADASSTNSIRHIVLIKGKFVLPNAEMDVSDGAAIARVDCDAQRRCGTQCLYNGEPARN